MLFYSIYRFIRFVLCPVETASYKKLPQIINFRDENGNDRMQEEIQANYNRVKQEVQQIVTDEMERIKNDPELSHLIKDKEE